MKDVVGLWGRGGSKGDGEGEMRGGLGLGDGVGPLHTMYRTYDDGQRQTRAVCAYVRTYVPKSVRPGGTSGKQSFRNPCPVGRDNRTYVRTYVHTFWAFGASARWNLDFAIGLKNHASDALPGLIMRPFVR